MVFFVKGVLKKEVLDQNVLKTSWTSAELEYPTYSPFQKGEVTFCYTASSFSVLKIRDDSVVLCSKGVANDQWLLFLGRPAPVTRKYKRQTTPHANVLTPQRPWPLGQIEFVKVGRVVPEGTCSMKRLQDFIQMATDYSDYIVMMKEQFLTSQNHTLAVLRNMHVRDMDLSVARNAKLEPRNRKTVSSPSPPQKHLKAPKQKLELGISSNGKHNTKKTMCCSLDQDKTAQKQGHHIQKSTANQTRSPSSSLGSSRFTRVRRIATSTVIAVTSSSKQAKTIKILQGWCCWNEK